MQHAGALYWRAAVQQGWCGHLANGGLCDGGVWQEEQERNAQIMAALQAEKDAMAHERAALETALTRTQVWSQPPCCMSAASHDCPCLSCSPHGQGPPCRIANATSSDGPTLVESYGHPRICGCAWKGWTALTSSAPNQELVCLSCGLPDQAEYEARMRAHDGDMAGLEDALQLAREALDDARREAAGQAQRHEAAQKVLREEQAQQTAALRVQGRAELDAAGARHAAELARLQQEREGERQAAARRVLNRLHSSIIPYVVVWATDKLHAYCWVRWTLWQPVKACACGKQGAQGGGGGAGSAACSGAGRRTEGARRRARTRAGRGAGTR